jgi:hypothetical protein
VPITFTSSSSAFEAARAFIGGLAGKFVYRYCHMFVHRAQSGERSTQLRETPDIGAESF